MSTQRLHVVIHGHVQGVGYRYSAYRTALALGLNGWVRNLPGGQVEAEFEGAQGFLNRMLDWCRQGPSLALVSRVDTTWTTGDALYDSFQIRG